MRWLCIVTTLMCAAAFAANPKASALAKDAERLYKDGKFREAADALKDAYDFEAVPKFVYNRARALDQAGDLAEAMETYRQYLALPADETEPELVKKATASIERLRPQVSKQPDKSSKTDKPGKTTGSASSEPAGDTPKRLKPAEAEATQGGPKSKPSVRKLAAFGAGGGAVLFAALGIGLGAAANGARLSFATAKTLAEKVTFEASTRGLAVGADVCLVLSLAAAVTAVVLFPKVDDLSSSLAVSLVPTQGGGFASVEVQF